MPESDKNALKNYVFIPKTQKEKKNLSYLKKKNAFSTQKPLLENDFSIQNLNPFFWIPIKNTRGIAKANVNTGLNRNYAIATQRLSLICYVLETFGCYLPNFPISVFFSF